MLQMVIGFLGAIALVAVMGIITLASMSKGIPSEIPTFGLAALTGLTGILVKSDNPKP